MADPVSRTRAVIERVGAAIPKRFPATFAGTALARSRASSAFSPGARASSRDAVCNAPPRRAATGLVASSPTGKHAAGAGKDLRGGHALHPAAVQVVEAAFYRVSPRRFHLGSEAARPQLGVQAFADLLPGLAGESANLGLDLFNGIHPAGDDVDFPVAGNCAEGWH